jgi:hypothetical protein
MEVHACNPSTQEVEAGGSQGWYQSGLHTETLSQKKKKKKEEEEEKVAGHSGYSGSCI